MNCLEQLNTNTCNDKFLIFHMAIITNKKEYKFFACMTILLNLLNKLSKKKNP